MNENEIEIVYPKRKEKQCVYWIAFLSVQQLTRETFLVVFISFLPDNRYNVFLGVIRDWIWTKMERLYMGTRKVISDVIKTSDIVKYVTKRHQ